MAKYVLSDIFEGNYSVTQLYAANSNYYKQFNLAGHEGVDWGTPVGTPVIAPFDGFILRSNTNDKDYGTYIVIWDPTQLCAVWFCHLSNSQVQAGQKISNGDILGHSGNSGNVQPAPTAQNPNAGAHLHVNFVETDTQANRLNMENGFQGFLNILDPNLVEWRLSRGQSTPASQPPQMAQFAIPAGDNSDDYMIIRKTDFANMHVKCDQYDAISAAGYHALSDIDTKIAQLIQDKQNVVNQNDGEVKQLNDEVDGYKKEVSSLNIQLSTLMDNYKQKCEEDSTTAQTSLREGHDLQAKTQDIQTISDALNAKPDKGNILKAISDLRAENDRLKAAQPKFPIIQKTSDNLKSIWKVFGLNVK